MLLSNPAVEIIDLLIFTLVVTVNPGVYRVGLYKMIDNPLREIVLWIFKYKPAIFS
jgi:hypothetical protein